MIKVVISAWAEHADVLCDDCWLYSEIESNSTCMDFDDTEVADAVEFAESVSGVHHVKICHCLAGPDIKAVDGWDAAQNAYALYI